MASGRAVEWPTSPSKTSRSFGSIFCRGSLRHGDTIVILVYLYSTPIIIYAWCKRICYTDLYSTYYRLWMTNTDRLASWGKETQKSKWASSVWILLDDIICAPTVHHVGFDACQLHQKCHVAPFWLQEFVFFCFLFVSVQINPYTAFIRSLHDPKSMPDSR